MEGIKGRVKNKILISYRFYHPHPDPPPIKGEGFIGFSEVVGQPLIPAPAKKEWHMAIVCYFREAVLEN